MNRKQPKCKYQHIMLVDDSELDNFINQKIIESSNFASKVYISTSSKSALEFLNNLAVTGEVAQHLYPQIIFIDLNMPIIDGFQFIELLKANSNIGVEKYKLVILTSSIHPNDKKKAVEIYKNITFLNKPLTEEMLASL